VDFSPILDLLGDDVTAAVGGLLIGAFFGAAAQRSRFCLRSAAIEFTSGRIGPKVAVWLLAFTGAMAATQVFIALDWLEVAEARQLSARGSLSGAIVGGAMFGTGMILTRGCASRLLVLSANGNLRALLSGLVFAVVAQASLEGALAPLRLAIWGWWTIDGTERDLLATFGASERTGLVIGLLLLAGALGVALRNRLSASIGLGALGVGFMVGMGWLLTYTLSTQTFDPTPVESLTFSGPSADTLMLFLTPLGGQIDFDVGLVPGVFLGSFVAALLARELRLEGFNDGQSMRRYILGAALMGFGGMLAGGCAVGAGVTGGSIFALTAWVTLAAIWAAGGLTYYLVDRPTPALPPEDGAVLATS
jgi:uncharacterized membrane protein YedE/YeeE